LFVHFVFLWYAVAVVGIVVGLVRLRLSHNPGFFPLAVFPLVFPVTFYIAHTTLRHRHPCDPVIALILALGIVGIVGWRGAHRIKIS